MRTALLLLALFVASVLPAVAGDSGTVLIYGPSLIGAGTEGLVSEFAAAISAGYTVDVADEGVWSSMTSPDFAEYDAIIVGDGGCFDPSGFELLALDANKTSWSPAVTGNVLVHTFNATATLNGMAPFEADPFQLLVDGITFAAGGLGTGLYYANGCRTYGSSETPFVIFPIPPLSEIGEFVLATDANDSVAIVDPSHPAMANSTDLSLSSWGPSTWASFIPPPSEGGDFPPPGFEIIAVTGAPIEIVSPVALARDGGKLFEEHFVSDLGQAGSQDGGGPSSIWYWEGFCAANALPRPSPLEGGIAGGAARFGVPSAPELPEPAHCSDYGHVARFVASNCCESNGSAGCSDPICEGIVCGTDSFCCDDTWDSQCAAEAVSLCDAVCDLSACGDGSDEVLVSPPLATAGCYPGGGAPKGGAAQGYLRLSFNYLLDYEEGFAFDRARVVARFGAVPALEGVIPVELATNEVDGGLIDNDGVAWQQKSLLIPLPPGAGPDGPPPVTLQFFAELIDGCNNRGAGFYVDDVVLECAGPPPIFEDGFESGDTTAWSTTVSP